MKQNMKAWAKSMIESKQRNVLPIMTYPGLLYTGNTIPELVTNGEIHYKCIKALSEHYPTAASVIIMDLSLEAQAFGCVINVNDDDVPTIKERLVTDNSKIAELKIPAIGAGRTGEYLKAAKLASDNIKDKPVLGGMIGPYSLAGRLFDISEFMVNVMVEPDASHELLKKCTQFLKEYAKAYKEAGCNGIVIAEPAAGLLDYDTCHNFSSVYVKEIVDYVQDENFMVVLHNCGKTVELVPSMLSTGANAYHFGNAIDMADILPQIPADKIAMGNVDPAGVLKGGTPDSIKSVTTSLLEKMKPYKNFVLSSGCDVPPKTPKENIDAFFAALKEFNSK